MYMNNFFARTTETAREQIDKLVSRVGHEFLAPLYANAYILVMNQVFSAGLGVVYWALAAHLFSADVVGQNSAIISTMMFLGALAELSLKAAMSRFVPRAGKHTTRLVVSAYAVNILAALLVTLAFFALGNYFSFTFALLTDTRVLPIILLFVPLFWAIFTVQDGVLNGLRESKWVLYENTVYNIIKIVLLGITFLIGYRYSLAASWFLPTPLLILLVNGLIFFRFIPRYTSAPNTQPASITVKQVAASVTGDHIGNIFAEACVRLLPLMVLDILGKSSNAYFYQAWLIGNTIYLIAYNLMTSFSVEASSNMEQIAAYSRRILVQKARLVTPLALAVLVFAPFILKIFGDEYALQGTSLLRWLALATFPMILNIWYLGYVRVIADNIAIIRNQTIILIVTLGLSYLWLPTYGISSVGVAWLLAQSVVAAIVIYRTAPVLLSRVSNYDAETTLSRNLRMRRADWRFLTSITHPRKTVCYKTNTLLVKAVAAVTLEQVVNGKKTSSSDFDLAVAINPDSSTLQAAHKALQSGGVLYTEWDSWRMGGANRIRHQLEKAGFSSIKLFWAYPTIDTPHVWLPIELEAGPYAYLLKQNIPGDLWILRFARSIIQYFLYAIVHSGFLPHLSAIAYKEMQSSPDFVSAICEEWSRAYGAGGKLSYIFKTGGTHLSSIISYTLFNPGKQEPDWIVKFSRLDKTGRDLEREYSILSALNETKTNTPALFVPHPVFFREHLGIHAIGQTTLNGIPLNKTARTISFEEAAKDITDWQIELAERTLTEWPHAPKEQVFDQLLTKLFDIGAGILTSQELAQALASLRTLKDLPLVCVHNDFAPWNLIQGNSRGLGAIDWGNANWSGLPMMDLIYSLSTLAFLSEDAWETSQRAAIYQRFLTATNPIGKTFTEYLNRYAEHLGIPHQRIPSLRLATWVFHCCNEYENNKLDYGMSGLSSRTTSGLCYPILKAELTWQSDNTPI
jgi:O-antigen/teichoic acid export membrane protein